MAIDLNPKQRETGKANFQQVAGDLTRRGFMKSMGVGASVAAASPLVYFGYKSIGKPVKAALIGGGDEGGILVGAHNPDFLKFVAIADIRPYNRERIMKGDPKVPLRPGFNKLYGPESKDIAIYDDYRKILDNKDIEAVVIATPLSTHAKIAIDCMRAGKHVLCEKLMAWNISQCKKMIQVAKETGRILSIGHQRHYSMLYAHAHEILEAGILGEVRHIRALWHRNNSWPFRDESAAGYKLAEGYAQPHFRDGWYPPIYDIDEKELKGKTEEHGFKSVEELVRWRLYNETGGGLMAELGSHQMDACSIFLGKVHPLAVTGVGGKFFYGPGRNDRESDDSIFITYEFPGPNHPLGKNKGKDSDDIVVVTYSSLNTNSFESYGECVMGSRGSMVVEQEQSIYLYTERDPNKKATDARSTEVSVTTGPGGKPAMEASSTWGPGAGPPAAGGGAPAAGGPGAAVSRGYKEEMEDFAYCIREWDSKLGYEKDPAGRFKQRLPRCHGEVAMADAIIALTANLSMKSRQRIEFNENWFKGDAPEVPDKDTKPRLNVT
ncbi:MAG: Gfo/Idh/MocA family oxidoreductase [Planctomycetes bacterium]|nr:Gfo/Idh/MocA family oxidoreductase [Planctomycetota bacterium]